MFRLMAVTLVAATALLFTPDASLARQNQTPPRPQTPGQPAAGNQSPSGNRSPSGNQSPAGNQTPAKPPEPLPPPGVALHISPGVVQLIQQKLAALGHPVPTISGAWGANTAIAVAEFQKKHGLDAGGDLDERTLVALGMPEVLRGEIPAGAEAPVGAQAIATGGAPLTLSPSATRLLQNKLTEGGFVTDNVFGIWMAGSEKAARDFQKAKGLGLSSTLDLRILHALGLTTALTEPKPGKLPTDNVAQVLSDEAVPFTGAPLFLGPAGIRQIQTALKEREQDDVVVDGTWSEATAASLKKFQEAQKLEPTGNVNLHTLRALGFTNPLVELDQASATTRAKPKP